MSSEHSSALENTRHRTEPYLRQCIFNWNTKDKYIELKNVEMEVINIFLTEHCEINYTEAPIIRNWLGREELQFIQTLMTYKQEACEIIKGLFGTLSKKFKQ